MKLITRTIVGGVGALCTGVCIGMTGRVILQKSAETICKNKVGQALLYSMGAAGLVVLTLPVIEKVSSRMVNWAFKEEDEKRLKELQELLEKQNEEESE